MKLTKQLLTLILLSLSLTTHAEYHRSQKAKAIFKFTHPCPAAQRTKGSCPGYIIDHINPIACGGAYSPENMQWQTKVEANDKDKWERRNCN